MSVFPFQLASVAAVKSLVMSARILWGLMCGDALPQVKADQILLVQQLRAKGDENEKLQLVIVEKDKTLKKQEVQMLQMAKMESEIQSLKAQSLIERKKLESQHAAKTSFFETDILRLTKLEAENERCTPLPRILHQYLCAD